MVGMRGPSGTNSGIGRIDLHTHSLLSDGELLPAELVRRAEVKGYSAIAITDHAGPSNVDWVVKRASRAAEELNRFLDIRVLAGVELTHVPPRMLGDLANEAKRMGAEIVVVHGESPVEPVRSGTNQAALECSDVDILGHPGFLSWEQGDQAREAGIYLELTSRGGHRLANGWVARVAKGSKAQLLVNTDAHGPEDLIGVEEALKVARAAGLSDEEAKKVVIDNPRKFLERL